MNLGDSVYRLKEHLQAEGIEGLAVDIDDTKSHTSDAYFDRLSEKYPIPDNLVDVITKEVVRKHYALTGKVLHWGEIPGAKEYVYSHVDDPEFHSNLKPISGAVTGTQKLYQRDLLACNLTMRSEGLEDTTKIWLPQHGFPQLPIAMKSNDVDFEKGAEWKAAALVYLFPHVNRIIDNDARIARILEEMGYPGDFYLIGLNEQEYKPSKIVTPVETWPELTEIILRTIQVP